MLTSARRSDRSQDGGLVGLRALQLNQTPRSKCKQQSGALHQYNPSLYKSIKWPLVGEAHPSPLFGTIPRELDVTSAPLGLFIYITICWFTLQTRFFLVGHNRNALPSKIQQILRDKCLWLS